MSMLFVLMTHVFVIPNGEPKQVDAMLYYSLGALIKPELNITTKSSKTSQPVIRIGCQWTHQIPQNINMNRNTPWNILWVSSHVYSDLLTFDVGICLYFQLHACWGEMFGIFLHAPDAVLHSIICNGFNYASGLSVEEDERSLRS